MRSFLLLLIVLFGILPFTQIQAQTTSQPTDTTKNKVYVLMDISPQFPGGEKAMMEFFASKLKFVNMINKPEGIVLLQFIVTETGKIEDINILKSLEPSLDSAAIKAVQQMPNWNPGVVKGKIEKVRFNLPVRFSNSYPGQTKEKRKEKRKK